MKQISNPELQAREVDDQIQKRDFNGGFLREAIETLNCVGVRYNL